MVGHMVSGPSGRAHHKLNEQMNMSAMKKAIGGFRRPALSAITPRNGAVRAVAMPAIVTVRPERLRPCSPPPAISFAK
jgi:hypothetical protein